MQFKTLEVEYFDKDLNGEVTAKYKLKKSRRLTKKNAGERLRKHYIEMVNEGTLDKPNLNENPFVMVSAKVFEGTVTTLVNVKKWSSYGKGNE